MTLRGRTGAGRARIAFAALLLTFALQEAGSAASRYDPRLRFRTISTPRFDIHFHQGEDAQARRLAGIAEEVARQLDPTLGRPSSRVHVVLVNQTDLSNGWATPVPYNLIEITAAGPSAGSQIGNSSDWLRVVFTHEYTHIVHLDKSRSWIGGLRKVLGRNPALFPNLTLPLWAIEGTATYEESVLTGEGRVPAGDFRQIVTAAAAAGSFEPIDRAGGGLDDWPSGSAQYAYGAYFNQYLSDRYGPESLRRLADESAGRVPYFGSPAYRKVFGRSLGKLWTDFAADAGQRLAATTASPARRITDDGFTVAVPRFGPDGTLYYAIANPHGFPAMMARRPGSSRSSWLTTRYLGDGMGFAGDWLVFDQLELVASVGLQSDLFAWSVRERRTIRLTRGERAGDPDVSPDGRRVVFTRQLADRRELVTGALDVDAQRITDIRALVSAAGVELAGPRWSPDGRTIVAERREAGSRPGLVLVDANAGEVSPLPTAAARPFAATWTPDGMRILFSAADSNRPFQIHAVDRATGAEMRLEGTGASAQAPAVAPDGRTLAFVGYTTEGYDLFSLDLERARWIPVAPEPARDGRPPSAPLSAEASSPELDTRSYSPRNTLAPRFWTPTVESDNGELVVGAASGGADALARHVYGAEVGWGTRGRPDWQLAYAYDRWRPTFFANVADDTDPWRSGTARSREMNAGILLPFRRVRFAQSLFGAFHAATDTLACSTCATPIDARASRSGVRTGYTFSSARTYGYSVSREEGLSVSVTNELLRRALGSDGDAGSAVADLRGYLPLRPRHAVLAVRAAMAHAWGDREVRRAFTASGNGPASGSLAFDNDAIGLLRGFDDDESAANAAVLNLDYRVPVWRPQRGFGTLPFFARTLHAAAFLDVGRTWEANFGSGDRRWSTGLEISLDSVVGYVLPVTLTGGAALRHDGPRHDSDVVLFGRIGRAF